MLRIRKVADATTAPNRAAIEAAQKIMREQFSAMPDYDIAKLPEQLSNPLKHRFVARLFVDNLGRYLDGKPLREIVDRAAGY